MAVADVADAGFDDGVGVAAAAAVPLEQLSTEYSRRRVVSPAPQGLRLSRLSVVVAAALAVVLVMVVVLLLLLSTNRYIAARGRRVWS